MKSQYSTKYFKLILTGLIGLIILSYVWVFGDDGPAWIRKVTESVILIIFLVTSVLFISRINKWDLALRKAQEGLNLSREMLNYIIKHDHCAIAVLDNNLRYIYVSDRYLKEFKINEDIIGKHHYEVFSRLPEKFREVYQRVLNGEVCEGENDFTGTEEDPQWINWEYRPWYSKNNAIGGILIYVESIADQKETERKLLETELRYKTLFYKDKAIFLLWDIDTLRIIDVNPAACDFYGWTYEELTQKKISDINLCSLEEIYSAKQKIISEEKNHFNLEHRLANGEIREIEVHNGPITIDGQRLVYSRIYDITERKKIENKLHESEELFNTIIKASPDLIVVSDFKGEFLSVSQVSASMFGVDNQEGMGHCFTDYIVSEDRIRARDALIQKIQGNYDGPTPFRGVRADGTIFDIEVNTDFIKDAEGKPTKIVFVIRDISQRIKTEKELILAKEKAEESDRLKSAFLANMSHEIRTPMNGILGFAELLKEPKLTGEERNEYLNIIESSGERLLSIINDIVEISKIETGIIHTKISEININEHLDYIGRFFKLEIAKKGMTLKIKKEIQEDVIVNTDSEKLYAILMNLVKNAIKYSEKGTIEIGCVKNRTYFEFHVKDTGIGIPEEKLGAIFDRFVQVDSGKKKIIEGTGLGLAISKAYVEMLGGSIWVKSQLNEGSTFFFTIPCKKSAAGVAENLTMGNDSKSTSISQNLKVLVAEDDKISAKLFSKYLDPYCSRVYYAKTGVEAIQIFKNNPGIQLILMDVQMSEMNGYEATKEIRKINQSVIIVAQTAYALAEDKKSALEVGCNDYISKPINRKTIEYLLAKYFTVKEVELQ